jgi:membrane protein implicated in regulation of membrane protease activity
VDLPQAGPAPRERLGLSLAQEGALELGATAGLLATASVHYLPALWPMTVVFGLAALLIPLYPATAWAIVGVLYPVLGLDFLFALNRVARRVAPRGSVARLRQRQVKRRRGSPPPVQPSTGSVRTG